MSNISIDKQALVTRGGAGFLSLYYVQHQIGRTVFRDTFSTKMYILPGDVKSYIGSLLKIM